MLPIFLKRSLPCLGASSDRRPSCPRASRRDKRRRRHRAARTRDRQRRPDDRDRPFADLRAASSFGPSSSIHGESFDTHLFYVESGGLFLLLEVNTEGILQRADVVEREDTLAGVNHRQGRR